MSCRAGYGNHLAQGRGLSRQAAYRVNRDPANQDSIGWNEHFAEALGFQGYDLDWPKVEERIKCYFLHRWYCTDTYVGVRVYWMDDQPLAVSGQSARKAREEFMFLDVERAKAAREFLLTCAPTLVPEFKLIGEETIKLDNAVSFTGQLLDYEGLVDGKPVSLNRRAQFALTKKDYIAKSVELPDGTIRPIEDFRIPLKITPA